MTLSPHLVRDGDEWRLDASVGGGRRRFALSDRAAGLLVADLGYGDRDVVPWLFAKVLVLAGDARPPGGDTDPLETAWSLTGAEGGREATDRELAALGDHLRAGAYGPDERAALQEHVKRSALAAHLDPDEVGSREGRVRGLQEIARGLEE